MFLFSLFSLLSGGHLRFTCLEQSDSILLFRLWHVECEYNEQPTSIETNVVVDLRRTSNEDGNIDVLVRCDLPTI
jgi:hypothetical protein